MSEEELIDAIKRLNKTVAMLAVKGEERDKQIKILLKLGFSQGDMVDIMGMDKGNLSRAIASIKNKSKEKTGNSQETTKITSPTPEVKSE